MTAKDRAIGVVVLLSFGFALAGCPAKPAAPPPPAPPKVTVAHPEERELVDYDEYNGWLKAAATVEVRARVRGHIAKVHFTDGQVVEKGAPLFTLDKRPLEAEVARAQSQVRVFEAQRYAAEREFVRLRDLATKGAASQSQVDEIEAKMKAAEAQIDATKQDIEFKRLDVEYAEIAAPIAGRTSRAQLTEGNLVNAGGSDPLLTTIVSIDPMYFYFDVGERALQQYAKRQEALNPEFRKTHIRDRKIPASFGLDTDAGFPHEGILNFAENVVDSGTGTVQVRGEVPNPNGRFVPGSRVRVRVPISEPYKALLVPDTAVLTDQDRKYLLVLGDKNVVLRRDMTPGKLLDDGKRVVLAPAGAKEGAGAALKKDDRVIVLGLQRARVNYPVEPLDADGKPVAAAGAAPAGPATAGAK